MYESFYGLKANPFRLAPDPHFFYPSSGHKRGLAYLRYGLQQGQGFVAVTGVPGTGKTMLLQTLLAELSAQSTVVATLSSTNLSADDVLRAAADAFGVRPSGTSKAEFLSAIERFFTVNVQNGKRVLLIVDEAQNLPPRSLEELRMLSNFQLGNKALLQIILLGQQQLRQILADPDMEQLSQRIIAACHLQPISAEETRAYIEHRLCLAGWSGDPSLTGEALALICRCSKGLPRLINVFCERLFLSAYLDEKHLIDASVVHAMIAELRHEAGAGWDFTQLDALSLAEEKLAPLPDPNRETTVENLSVKNNEPGAKINTPDESHLAHNEKAVVAGANDLTEVDRYGRVHVSEVVPEPAPSEEKKLNPAAEVIETTLPEAPQRESAKVITLPRKRVDLQQFEMPPEPVVTPPRAVVRHDSGNALSSFRRMGLWLGIGILTLVAVGSWWVTTRPSASHAGETAPQQELSSVTETSPLSGEPAAGVSIPEESSPPEPIASRIETSALSMPAEAKPLAEKPAAKEVAIKEQKGGVTTVAVAPKQPVVTAVKKSEQAVATKANVKSVPTPVNQVTVAGIQPKIADAATTENLLLDSPPAPVTNTVAVMSEPKASELVQEANQKPVETAKARELVLTDIAFKLEEFYNGGQLQSFVGLFANDASADGSQGRKRIARDYRELFESTEMREMKINDLEWQEADGKISGVGDFEVNIWRRGEDAPRVSKGKINVVVVDEGGRLVIKRLSHKSR